MSRKEDRPVEIRTLSREVEVRNARGVHSKPCARIALAMRNIDAEVWFDKDGVRVSARELMDVISLAMAQGSRVTIHAEGADAEKALNVLEDLFDRGFGDMQN